MTAQMIADLSLFVLGLLVGFEVISKVPSTLHTPLMSGANAIHGVVLVGVMLLALTADGATAYVLCFLAAVFAALNVVGGYVVTDRMLAMFRGRSVTTVEIVARLAYLAAATCFVLGLHLMNHPATARKGNRLSAAGMLIAVAATAALLVDAGAVTATAWVVVGAGTVVGAAAGLYGARRVSMTAMPQLVSLFNAAGGGAAALIAVHDVLRFVPEGTCRSGSRCRRHLMSPSAP